MKLVVIAAGGSSRLRSFTNSIPKCLLKIDNKPILDYILDNCIQVGIKDIIIVTGYLSDILIREVTILKKDLNVKFVHNPNWKSPNGLSVLTAKSLIQKRENFLISMSDHVYDLEILKKVMNSSLSETWANVGLDFNSEDVFDIDDAMKVKVNLVNPTVITDMAKDLVEYDAVDCGVFKCRYEFFDALESAKRMNKYSLSDTCNILIRTGKMGGVDIGDSFWIDIDTPEALKYCEKRLSCFIKHVVI